MRDLLYALRARRHGAGRPWENVRSARRHGVHPALVFALRDLGVPANSALRAITRERTEYMPLEDRLREYFAGCHASDASSEALTGRALAGMEDWMQRLEPEYYWTGSNSRGEFTPRL